MLLLFFLFYFQLTDEVAQFDIWNFNLTKKDILFPQWENMHVCNNYNAEGNDPTQLPWSPFKRCRAAICKHC